MVALNYKNGGGAMYPLEWLKFNRLTTPNVGDDVEELELSHIAGGNVKWYSHFGKSFLK